MNKLYQHIVGLLHKIGMDRAIAYGSGARVIQAVAGVVTLFFITAFMTGVEQGYYYTFTSLIGLQVFFELGFTGIITQFVAHEASHLKIDYNSNYTGEEKYRSRLSSFLHFSLKWYSIASVFFIVVLIIIGFHLFSNKEGGESVDWFLPYLIVCVSTAIKMLQAPFTAMLMGLNKVTEMNRIMFYQQVVTPVIMWLLLIFHAGLYVVGVSSLLAVIVWFYYVLKTDMKIILFNLYKIEISDKVNYTKEIFPFQWKIAVSSLSGYFIFSFITPILFKYQGPIIAGQMGMTISVVSAIQALAMTWQSTKVPLYSNFIALKKYTELDDIFNKTTRQMLIICVTIMMATFIALCSCDIFKIGIEGKLLSKRFLVGWPLLFLMVSYSLTSLTFAWATYLRCHKQEPYMWMSLVSGFLCLVCIWISAKFTNIFYITLFYMIVRISVMPWSYSIYSKNKERWHSI